MYSDKVGDNNKQLMLQPEQKHISLMMDVVSKFSQPGSIVMDPLGGSFAIARMFFPSQCISIVMPGVWIPPVSIMGCCSWWRFMPESCLIRSLIFLARTFSQFLDSIRARKHAKIWCIPLGLLPVQLFPQHILHYVSSCYEDYSHACVLKLVPNNDWLPAWR